jgi:hypothetical protein
MPDNRVENFPAGKRTGPGGRRLSPLDADGPELLQRRPIFFLRRLVRRPPSCENRRAMKRDSIDRRALPPSCLAVMAAALALAEAVQTARPQPSPEAKAAAFLAVEVPRWAAENKCYSCHNNGAAARALYWADRSGAASPGEALADTTEWLKRPKTWDDNGGDRSFSDRTLSRIQFGLALAEAVEAGRAPRSPALVEAAESIAELQSPEGPWSLETGASIGSPATMGNALASWAARRILASADPERFAESIRKADAWFRRAPSEAVLDSAAVALALGAATDDAARAKRRECLASIARGQSRSGGWGAYLTSPSEPFDTAIVLLALAPLLERPESLEGVWSHAEAREAVRRGRAFLIERQLDDGSWPETTRPPGQVSYAQYIATSGWATQALLATRDLK